MHRISIRGIAGFVAFILVLLMAGQSCRVSQESPKTQAAEMKDKENQGARLVGALPPMIIYKTKADYRFNVPVTLNPEKTAVIIFPAPTDLNYEGELAVPAILEQDYLLDFRGINQNTAFLSITYEEYSKLEQAPSPRELFEMVLDKDPFTEIYICGVKEGREADIAKALEMIRTGRLGECTRWNP